MSHDSEEVNKITKIEELGGGEGNSSGRSGSGSVSVKSDSLKYKILNQFQKFYEYFVPTNYDYDYELILKNRQPILLGWIIIFSLLIVQVGIFIQYYFILEICPKTHGWKALTVIMGMDVDDEHKHCVVQTSTYSNQITNYTHCLPSLYFGRRSFGLFLYFGMYLIFIPISALFLQLPIHGLSFKLRRILDNVIFLIGLVTLLDILMVVLILNYKLGGILTVMLGDKIYFPGQFISHYWKETQTRGQCCGPWGTVEHWSFKDAQTQLLYPSSCCNFKTHKCLKYFSDKKMAWEKGCLLTEYYFILLHGGLHILGLALQFTFLILFDMTQRRIKDGARKTLFPIWFINIFKSHGILPIISTRMYFVSHRKDWPSNLEYYTKPQVKSTTTTSMMTSEINSIKENSITIDIPSNQHQIENKNDSILKIG